MPGDLSVISVDVTESPPYLIGVSVANKSPRYANDAPLILCIFEDEELVYTDTALVSVSGDSVRFHEFGPWAPSQIREYLFTTEVI